MGINYRKKISLGNGTSVNVTKNGITSFSKKLENVTINSKGTVSINLGNGLTYKTSCNKKKEQKNNTNTDSLNLLIAMGLLNRND